MGGPVCPSLRRERPRPRGHVDYLDLPSRVASGCVAARPTSGDQQGRAIATFLIKHPGDWPQGGGRVGSLLAWEMRPLGGGYFCRWDHSWIRRRRSAGDRSSRGERCPPARPAGRAGLPIPSLASSCRKNRRRRCACPRRRPAFWSPAANPFSLRPPLKRGRRLSLHSLAVSPFAGEAPRRPQTIIPASAPGRWQNTGQGRDRRLALDS